MGVFYFQENLSTNFQDEAFNILPCFTFPFEIQHLAFDSQYSLISRARPSLEKGPGLATDYQLPLMRENLN